MSWVMYKERDLRLLPQLRHHVQQTNADRHVEHRDRLVGQDQFGPVGERLRESDALPLPAAEFVRVALQDVGSRRETDSVDDALGLGIALRRAT